MTLDQLRVFVAVAEREHLTGGAAAVHLTPSAATAAIQALEGRHGIKLFHRVGRRLELSGPGRDFLPEARAVLAAAAAAELALQDLGGLARGRLALAASQTLANAWLPPVLMRFAEAHPGIVLSLQEGNTAGVAEAVLAGTADLGCIEGEVDAPALAVTTLAEDRLVVVGAPRHPLADRRGVTPALLAESTWVMREQGSGTRAMFEGAMRAAGRDPARWRVLLTLPTNEAVCAAVARSDSLTAVSELAARAHLQSGRLRPLDMVLPARRFCVIRHKERFRTRAALAFEAMLHDEARSLARWQDEPTYDI